MAPKTKNPEKLNSEIEEPISSVEKIKRDTIRQLVGPSWKERHEKIMEESEDFMNELYKMSKEFTPTNEVFFEVEEENGTVKEINFRDLRKEPSGKRPAKEQKFLAGVRFAAQDNGSHFCLATYGPTVYYSRGYNDETKKLDIRNYTPADYSTSRTGYVHNLSDLLKQIKRKIETVNYGRFIEETTLGQREQLEQAFSMKKNKDNKNQ